MATVGTERGEELRARPVTLPAERLESGGPIRVVLFGGSYLEEGAEQFLLMLDEHPEIEFVGGYFQSQGMDARSRFVERWRRRGPVTIPITVVEFIARAVRGLQAGRRGAAERRRIARLVSNLELVDDLHAPDVRARIQALAPQLGVIYGAPVLRPELYSIPTLGTLGIHHGRVPQYRGKKTTFWEMYNGERVAGVTIQRVNAGIDTGDVLRLGEVEIGTRSLRRVEREVQELGFRLYLDAILDVKHGRSVPQPQDRSTLDFRKYRQPTATDLLRFYLRRARRLIRPGA